MVEFHKIWVDQCEAADGIRGDFGLQKALGYLIGEKLVGYLRIADRDPQWAAEVPAFCTKVRELFAPHELREYFYNVKRVGALAHICDQERTKSLRTLVWWPRIPSRMLRTCCCWNGQNACY